MPADALSRALMLTIAASVTLNLYYTIFDEARGDVNIDVGYWPIRAQLIDSLAACSPIALDFRSKVRSDLHSPSDFTVDVASY